MSLQLTYMNIKTKTSSWKTKIYKPNVFTIGLSLTIIDLEVEIFWGIGILFFVEIAYKQTYQPTDGWIDSQS